MRDSCQKDNWKLPEIVTFVTEFTPRRAEICAPDLHAGVHKSETGLWNEYADENYDIDE